MSRIHVITTSVRTTSRMNSILNETMANRRNMLTKANNDETPERDCPNEHSPNQDIQFLRNNFSMERVHKLIEKTIEERLMWDRLSRTYDSWRGLSFAESLASEIRNRIKDLHYRKHRTVCILSLIEKQNQGVTAKMKFLMDSKHDNFTKYVYELPTYVIIVTVFLVYKD